MASACQPCDHIVVTSTICISRAILRLALAAAVVLVAAPPARADITAFLGVTPTPETRTARGFSGGFGLAIIGFEVEYASIGEDEAKRLPGLRTWSGNVLLQTPTEFAGFQLYGTAGLGAYREALDRDTATSSAVNLGGGVKLRLVGPLRLRLDYRVFRLQGSPRHESYQRVYAGANLAF